MAKVVMHKANDGTLFEKAKDCDTHNMKLRLKPTVKEFAENLDISSYGVERDDRENLVVFIEDLPDFIAAHADQLRNILNNALVIRKPRKVKKLDVVVGAPIA